MLGELRDGDHGRDDRGVDDLPPLVDDEATVGVSVEDQRQVGPVLADGALGVDEILRFEGVGRVVREGPVEVEEQTDDVEAPSAEHGDRGVRPCRCPRRRRP